MKNIVKNFLKPAYAPAMAHKLKLRLLNRAVDKRARAASLAWCREVAEYDDAFASRLDAELWEESKAFAEELQAHARRKLGALDVTLSGGGHYPLLYFITRYHKPEVVVETGVAAGFSTKAFLDAMQSNGKGRLYSSDLPLFRLEDPEQYVAVLVEEESRSNWRLRVEGYRRNLREILKEVPRVDLFHYDSDKTRSGRSFAVSEMEKVLTDDGTIIMDDIQDDLFFRDYVEQHGYGYKVFSFEGSYLGVVGSIANVARGS